MLEPELVMDFIGGVLLNAPTFLTLGAGAIAAGVMGPTHRAAAMRTLVGCTWLAGVYLFVIAWHTIFEHKFFPEGTSPGQQGAYLLFSLLEAIGFAILLFAIFAGRFPKEEHPFRKGFPNDQRERHDEHDM